MVVIRKNLVHVPLNVTSNEGDDNDMSNTTSSLRVVQNI